MKIARMTKGSWGKILAFFDVELSGMTVKGFKLISGQDGMFVGVPSVILGRSRRAIDYNSTLKLDTVDDGRGNWSISYVAREDSGHTGSARFLMGSDPRPSVSNPYTYPRIGFSNSNQFYFTSDQFDTAATVTGWGDRADMHNYIITCL